MELERIEALEWAIAEFEGAGLDGENLIRLDALRALHRDLIAASFAFDASKASLIQYMRRWRLTIPHREFDAWRMCLPEQQVSGAIRGLPESRGILRATNGILCYIDRVEKFPYLGHVEFFEPDVREGFVPYKKVGASAPRKPKGDPEIAALFASLEKEVV